jgi:hypothetical protein
MAPRRRWTPTNVSLDRPAFTPLEAAGPIVAKICASIDTGKAGSKLPKSFTEMIVYALPAAAEIVSPAKSQHRLIAQLKASENGNN